MQEIAIKAGLLLTSLLLSIVLAELGLRVLDGYDITSMTLVERRAVPAANNGPSTHHVATIPIASGVDRDWYTSEPEPTNREPFNLAAIAAVTPDIAQLYRQT